MKGERNVTLKSSSRSRTETWRPWYLSLHPRHGVFHGKVELGLVRVQSVVKTTEIVALLYREGGADREGCSVPTSHCRHIHGGWHCDQEMSPEGLAQ